MYNTKILKNLLITKKGDENLPLEKALMQYFKYFFNKYQ